MKEDWKEFIKKKTDIKYIAYIVTTIVILLLSIVYTTNIIQGKIEEHRE